MSSMIWSEAEVIGDHVTTPKADVHHCHPHISASISKVVSYAGEQTYPQENGDFREADASANVQCGLQADVLGFSMTGHTSPLAEGDLDTRTQPSMPQEQHDCDTHSFALESQPHVPDGSLENGNLDSVALSREDPCSENESLSPNKNGLLEAHPPKRGPENDALSHGRVLLPVTEFLKLAERQGSTQPLAKRLKVCGKECEEHNVDSALKHVADIVLVLAGLGQIRAGRAPTAVEKGLLAEAYGRLGFLVQDLAPRDLVSMDSVENLIEDLGLRRTEEEKVEVAMTPVVASSPPMETEEAEQGQEAAGVIGNERDMEDDAQEAQAQAVPAVSYSEPRRPQPVSSLAQLLTLPVPGLALDERGPISGLAANASSTQEPLTSAVPGDDFTVPRIVTPARKDETHLPQAELSNAYEQETHSNFEDQGSISSPTSALAQESISASAAQKQADASGARLTHKQLTRAMQDWIQSRSPADHSLPVAHLKPFMSVPVPCEICKMIVRDTGSVLICDWCEKAYHLRCLQPYQLKGIPKGDWYCPKCPMETQGRRRIPKYGRVRQGFSFSSSLDRSTGALQAAERSPTSVEAQMVLPQRTMGLVNRPPVSTGKLPMDGVEKQIGRKDMVPRGTRDDHGVADKSSRVLAKPMMDGSSRNFDTSQHVGGSFTALLDSFTQAETQQHPPTTVKVAQPPIQLPIQRPPQIQTNDRLAYFRSQIEQQSTMYLQSLPQSQFQGAKGGGNAGKVVGKDALQTTLHIDGAESSSLQPGKASVGLGGRNSMPMAAVASVTEQPLAANTGERGGGVAKGLEQGGSYRLGRETDHFGVEWIGDIVAKYDGKAFYSACSVGGFLYKLQDCALFRPETPGIPPYIARLQALWEDTPTGSKWVRVNWCYYPSDIPLIVGRPSNPEANEVYESNHGDNNLVGSIQGPCLVLRPESYLKEMERRRELLRSGHTNEGLFPIFLSRWLYDAPRAVFRLATDGAVIK